MNSSYIFLKHFASVPFKPQSEKFIFFNLNLPVNNPVQDGKTTKVS